MRNQALSDPPKIAFGFSVCMFAAGGVVLVALAIWLGTMASVLWTVFLCALFGVGLTLPLSIQLAQTGISRRVWSGRDTLAWVDVESVEWQQLTITLKGRNRQFIVPLALFYDAVSASEYVRSHLPPHLR